ncbi:MAG: NADH-quinone oxidoreductase subunit A [Bacteroidia bacterium]|nr:NADH-quinone oxidoreductase subunit A [Bacteroidia bacterium]
MSDIFSIEVAGSFGKALVFILGATSFVVLGTTVARLLGPHRPNPEKLSSYECGEDPVGESGIQFNIRFYVVALIFLVFEVEILFLFPWATVFADKGLIGSIPSWGILALVEMLAFVGILLLGLAYVWIKKDLAWVKPSPIQSQYSPPKEMEIYKKINRKYEGTVSPNKSQKEKVA